MRVKFENNSLVIVTGIAKEVIEGGIAALEVKATKDRPGFRLAVSKDGKGSIDQYSIVANAYIGGQAALVIQTPIEADLDAVKKQYGKVIVNAAPYLAELAAQASAEVATIDAVFEDVAPITAQ